MNLSCQNGNFQVLTCEILETTESIELKLSGNKERVNKLAVLKFQSNPIRLSIKSEIWNSGKLLHIYTIILLKQDLVNGFLKICISIIIQKDIYLINITHMVLFTFIYPYIVII